MTNKQRLEAANQRLIELGYIDAKLGHDRSAPTTTQDEVYGEAADILEAILAGNYTPFKPFGDGRGRELEAAIEWVGDAFEDIDESRVKLRRSSPILDRAEQCLKTIRKALQDQLAIAQGERVPVAEYCNRMRVEAGDK